MKRCLIFFTLMSLAWGEVPEGVSPPGNTGRGEVPEGVSPSGNTGRGEVPEGVSPSGNTGPREVPGVERRVDDLLRQMTPQEKLRMLGGTRDFYTQAVPRLGIPSLKMSDGPMGVHSYGLNTAYPSPIGLAASFDEKLARRFGEAMGQDAIAYGVQVILAPGMNLYRAPMCSRNFEYLGEDPWLAARMAVGVVQGIQSQGVMATAKHFICNNSEYGRMDHSSDVDERTLRELYLPAFEACVKEGKVAALMDAYNLVNGVYMSENAHLNKDIAKKEWGFDGVIMSDWGATHDGLAAARGGLDLEMPSGQFMNSKNLAAALADGRLSWAEVDDKVRRILRKTAEFGFLDHSLPEWKAPRYSQSSKQVALDMALEGSVLLKNEGHLLPFDRKRLKTLLVLGPCAYPAVPGGGGSSETKPFHAVSLMEGIGDVAGAGVRVIYAPESVDLDRIIEKTAFVQEPGGPPGLRGEYYVNAALEGTPQLVRADEKVDFLFGDDSFAPGAPVDRFSARWTGYFVPPADDDYRFYTSSDDGVRLSVDGQLLIDNWTPHAPTLDRGAISLKAGKPVKVKLEYFEDTSSAVVRLGVAGSQEPMAESTRQAAREADAVVYCAGYHPNQECEGFDRTFRLPPGQDGQIQQLAELNPRLVVLLTAGGNVDMQPWLSRVPALLHLWYPGQEGGTAAGRLLFGEANPSGKLPASFEARWQDNPCSAFYYPAGVEKRVRYGEGLGLGYRFYDTAAVKPQFPFGFGLSYTDFALSQMQVRPGPGDRVAEVSFTVTNRGRRSGAEVCQLYVHQEACRVSRPYKELKGFARVQLAPGQSRRVTLGLKRRDFSYWDEARHSWKADPGRFTLLVGNSSVHTPLRAEFELAQGWVDI